MHSRCGRFVIAFNGEIYNHLELRAELEPPPGGWLGTSDTETLIELCARVGIAEALRKCVGMFALALWDRKDRRLFLARDRLGEKPLYWGWQGAGGKRTLLFGSELKALQAHPLFSAAIEPAAVTSLMRWGYVAGPLSIWSGIEKLAPGTWLSVGQDGAVSRKTYWSAEEAVRAGLANPLSLNLEGSADLLEGALVRSIRGQMLSDVPLGALLSGGIDSSTVVALMQRESAAPVRTFSIGFSEDRFDESRHARAIARHLGTDHSEMIVTAEDALKLVPQLPKIYDEPFADSSQLPTILVSRMARAHVTVALSGDGGDELFGGYESHRIIQQVWRSAGMMPDPLRQVTGRALRASSGILGKLVRAGNRHSSPAEQISRLGRMLEQRHAQDAGAVIAERWVEPPLLNARFRSQYGQMPSPIAGAATAAEELMALDARRYLPDDILVKVDRAAMSCSLETRVPLLDHRIFELAWRMPMAHKLAAGQSKIALRRVLDRHVPRELTDRPKAGFSVPVADWLRGPLREWAGDLLAPDRLRAGGWFNEKSVATAWGQHLSGRANNQARLWSVLMFEHWREAQLA